MTAPKPRKEMLSRDYKAPKTVKGSHVELEGGRLISSATFSTSASKQAANADKRSELGNYYGDKVQLITGPIHTEVDTGRSLQPYPTTLNVCRQYGLMSDRQKELHNQGLKDNAPQVFSLTDRQRKQIHKKKK